MFKLNRKTEYALLALRFLNRNATGGPVRARTIAEHYDLPAPILSKVLQALKAGSLITSTKGAHGGYQLGQPLSQISFATILELFTDASGLVDCVDSVDCCEQGARCDIQTPMRVLNTALVTYLGNITVEDLFASRLSEPNKLPLSEAFGRSAR